MFTYFCLAIETEYQKLARAFALESENKRLNSDQIALLSQQSDELQELIDGQNERDPPISKEKLILSDRSLFKIEKWVHLT